jgi:hypothetical protein
MIHVSQATLLTQPQTLPPTIWISNWWGYLTGTSCDKFIDANLANWTTIRRLKPPHHAFAVKKVPARNQTSIDYPIPADGAFNQLRSLPL